MSIAPHKKRRWLISIGILIVLIFACSFLYYVSGIFPDKPLQSEDCDPEMQALMLGQDAFPEDWQMGDSSQDYRHSPRAKNNCRMGYGFPDDAEGGALYQVFSYRSGLEAAYQYNALNGIVFGHPKGGQPWVKPTDFELSSDIADAFIYACRIQLIDVPGYAHRSCEVYARYGKYIVQLQTRMSPEYMTVEDLAQVVEAIDNKMAEAD